LEQCHQRPFVQRALGVCNNEKEALSKCLHEARMASQNHQIIKNQEKNKEMKQTWKKLKEDEFGEDEFLLKLLQREKAKKGEK
jgi:COX assembly protein 2